MELRDLQVFIATVEEGSVRRAAGVLALTPGAVSRAINRLENTIDTVLFVRQAGSPATPTSAGTTLYRETKVAFAHLGRGVLMARHASTDAKIRVGLPPLPPTAEAHHLIARAARACDRGGLQIRRISWRDCFGGLSLASGHIDLAVSIIPGPNAALPELPLEPLERVAVLPIAHELAGRKSVAAAELDELSAVVAAQLSTRAAQVWALDPRTDGRPRRYARRAHSVSGMLAAIAAGKGFATMPAFTPLMWSRSDLAWPTLATDSACTTWLGFSYGPHTDDEVISAISATAGA